MSNSRKDNTNRRKGDTVTTIQRYRINKSGNPVRSSWVEVVTTLGTAAGWVDTRAKTVGGLYRAYNRSMIGCQLALCGARTLKITVGGVVVRVYPVVLQKAVFDMSDGCWGYA